MVSNPQRIATNYIPLSILGEGPKVSNPQRIATNGKLKPNGLPQAVGFKPSKDRYKLDGLNDEQTPVFQVSNPQRIATNAPKSLFHSYLKNVTQISAVI